MHTNGATTPGYPQALQDSGNNTIANASATGIDQELNASNQSVVHRKSATGQGRNAGRAAFLNSLQQSGAVTVHRNVDGKDIVLQNTEAEETAGARALRIENKYQALKTWAASSGGELGTELIKKIDTFRIACTNADTEIDFAAVKQTYADLIDLVDTELEENHAFQPLYNDTCTVLSEAFHELSRRSKDIVAEQEAPWEIDQFHAMSLFELLASFSDTAAGRTIAQSVNTLMKYNPYNLISKYRNQQQPVEPD